MKILLTGANGYIGKRLLPILVQDGHHVVCSIRDKDRFNPEESLLPYITIIEVDFLNDDQLTNIPADIEAAYYLIHSMSNSNDYEELEKKSAINFKNRINKTNAKQVIYLTGMVNENTLSKHLKSRKRVEDILGEGNYNLTALRAGIIIGSGSASFEIIRDLVEKLPVMIAPKWLNTKCQPIGIRDVLIFLTKALNNSNLFNKNFDIGCNDIMTYKEMLLAFAEFRGLKRKIITVPVMTPRLSSYWLYFVTSTSYKLATALVDSMKIEVVCRNNEINKLLDIQPESYTEALARAFDRINNNQIASSWKDSQISGVKRINVSDFIEVPTYGCFKDKRTRKVNSFEQTIDKIWSIGGDNGWYYANYLWRLRGYMDKLFGGIGLRRGRTNKKSIQPGDALDFWRVIYSNKEEGRLLLFAEMKLPGEAWLEFKIKDNQLIQTATFRPQGLFGRLYWYSVLPFHEIVFKGMINQLVKVDNEKESSS